MRKLLVVIDMQKDFVDGALGTEEAVSIVPNVIEKIKSYDKKDVFFTRDTHQADYMQTQEGKNLPVEHCIEGTEGWEIDANIRPFSEGTTIIDKPTFGSTKLAKLMKGIAEKEDIEIELVGLCTDICVVSNALMLKAAMPEVVISVDASCCAGVTPDKHAAALETMRSCQINVYNDNECDLQEAS
ncbi:MAG: cysteine hydrolase [Butyrivibrio sp.]|nr:cysteine hydrolase [Butyrivibrio sp.]